MVIEVCTHDAKCVNFFGRIGTFATTQMAQSVAHELRSKIDALQDALREVEFAGEWDTCPYCGGNEVRGHYDDCKLVSLLED